MDKTGETVKTDKKLKIDTPKATNRLSMNNKNESKIPTIIIVKDKARTNFGELLNLVYYKGYEIIVERAGKPTARVVPITKTDAKPKPKKDKKRMKELMKFAGIWSDEDTKEIVNVLEQLNKI